MRIVFGLIAAVLIYCGCYCLLLKPGRYVTYDGNGMLSRAKPVYRIVGPGEPCQSFGPVAEAIFAPINEIDRLLRPRDWPGPQHAQRRAQ